MKWQEFNYAEWKRQNDAFNHSDFDAAWKKALESVDILEISERLKGLEVYFSDTPYYAHWLCPGITLYLSMETNEVIGVEIGGIREML
jgi:hypothetical protein